MLCGPAGCGKSTWAAKHFLPTQVVSSDQCRALISDDPSNQSVSRDAFDLMYFIIAKRLMLGGLTVADATNLRREHRGELIRIAKDYRFNTTAVIFNIPVETCLARNTARKRRVPEEALLDQYSLLEKTMRTIEKEGFHNVYVLDADSQSNVSVRIARSVSRRSPQSAP